MEAEKQEKTIKDYLHLYLGCKFIHNVHKGVFELCGYNIYEAYAQNSLGVNTFDARQIKLILRPLSSITDDEIKELFHYEKVRHEYKDISFDRWTVENRTTGVITLTGITMNYTIPTGEGDHARSWTIEVSGMNAYDFKWCLSKGFDLFGLIDGGLAIQKPLPL